LTSVLLTGAGGFLGREVLAALVGRGYFVHAVRREKNGVEASHAVTWHELDLLDQGAARALMEAVRPSGLIHLAWDARHGIYWNSPTNLQWLAASLSLLDDFSRLGGKRAVVAGSCSEYHMGSPEPLDEFKSALLPDSLYGVSKNALRDVMSKWAPDAGISWAWARFFNVFGLHEKPNRLIPKVIRTLQQGALLSFDSGLTLRDFLHVSDAADALVTLFESAVQGPVNVASGEALSVREVVDALAHYLRAENCVAFDVIPDQADQPPSVVARIDRLRNEVGWQAKISSVDRMHETCEWWRSMDCSRK